MIAAARAANATGRFDEGARIIRALWRDGDFDHSTETLILREFGAALTRADHKYRVDRLLYAESFESGLRAAALAGAAIVLSAPKAKFFAPCCVATHFERLVTGAGDASQIPQSANSAHPARRRWNGQTKRRQAIRLPQSPADVTFLPIECLMSDGVAP